MKVTGVRLATAAAGIRYRDRDDLLLIELAEGASCAAVFTRNAFCAAPVTVAREEWPALILTTVAVAGLGLAGAPVWNLLGGGA